jgi:hypothetical protein
MGLMPKALIAVGSLLAAGTWAAPAQAAPTGAVVIKSCSATEHGVPLRVKMRFQLASAADTNDVRLARVRVSHPDGTGNFRETRVSSVGTGLFFESAVSDPRLGSAVWAERAGDRAVYRKRLNMGMTSVSAHVTFRLAGGKRANLTCTQTFPQN